MFVRTRIPGERQPAGLAGRPYMPRRVFESGFERAAGVRGQLLRPQKQRSLHISRCGVDAVEKATSTREWSEEVLKVAASLDKLEPSAEAYTGLSEVSAQPSEGNLLRLLVVLKMLLPGICVKDLLRRSAALEFRTTPLQNNLNALPGRLQRLQKVFGTNHLGQLIAFRPWLLDDVSETLLQDLARWAEKSGDDLAEFLVEDEENEGDIMWAMSALHHQGRSFISPENYVDEYRDLYQRFFVAKYMCEDCTTIDEIIASLEAEVAYLADLKREGFEAIAPVQDGHCDFEKAGGPEWGRPYAN